MQLIYAYRRDLRKTDSVVVYRDGVLSVWRQRQVLETVIRIGRRMVKKCDADRIAGIFSSEMGCLARNVAPVFSVGLASSIPSRCNAMMITSLPSSPAPGSATRVAVGLSGVPMGIFLCFSSQSARLAASGL